MLFRHTRVRGNAVEVPVGEESLRQRRISDEAYSLLPAEREDTVVHGFSVEHVEPSLIDEQRHIAVTEIGDRLLQGLQRPVGDTYIERFSRPHDIHERLQRLLDRRVGVKTVGIEQIDIVNLHAPQRLVERRDEVLAAAPLAVRAFPHAVTGFGRDKKLVAEGAEILVHEPSHGLLRRTRRHAVVIGEIEMGDTVVEGITGDGAAALIRGVGTEVMPETQTDLGKQHAAVAAAVESRREMLVTGRRRGVHKVKGVFTI